MSMWRPAPRSEAEFTHPSIIGWLLRRKRSGSPASSTLYVIVRDGWGHWNLTGSDLGVNNFTDALTAFGDSEWCPIYAPEHASSTAPRGVSVTCCWCGRGDRCSDVNVVDRGSSSPQARVWLPKDWCFVNIAEQVGRSDQLAAPPCAHAVGDDHVGCDECLGTG